MIKQGFSEVPSSLLIAFTKLSVPDIIGTLVYPVLMERTGLVRTGVIGFWSEFSMLVICLLSVFVHESFFSPTKYFMIGSCHQYKTTSDTTTINSIPFYCSTAKISVLMLVIGIMLSRFGKVVSQINTDFCIVFFCFRIGRCKYCLFNSESITTRTCSGRRSWSYWWYTRSASSNFFYAFSYIDHYLARNVTIRLSRWFISPISFHRLIDLYMLVMFVSFSTRSTSC